MPHKVKQNLTRNTLRKLQASPKASSPLVSLRIAYSEDSKLLTGYINKLINIIRIHPTHSPIQASFRWSTFNPPITNWPRACVNQECQAQMRLIPDYAESLGYIDHEWTDHCWSIRDILLADDDEVMISWDHDNIEGKIHDLIINDQEAITAHQQGFDLHTITCCNIFGYTLPTDLRNPHSSTADISWRTRYNLQGKDTKQRVLAKNFNHGSKYTKTWRFVYRIEGIEKYGITRDNLGQLARDYIQSKREAWQAKLDIMERIRRGRISRTLYGGRRVFFDSSEETAREGFSHMISGTVSDYNNETLILLERWLGDDVRLLHNAHDGDKIAVKRSVLTGQCWTDQGEEAATDILKYKIKQIIERPITYQGRTLLMTAGVKMYG